MSFIFSLLSIYTGNKKHKTKKTNSLSLAPPKIIKTPAGRGTSPPVPTLKKIFHFEKKKLPNFPGFWCWSPRAEPAPGPVVWPPQTFFHLLLLLLARGASWLYIVACQSVHSRPKSYLHCGFGSKWQNRGTGLKNLNLCSEQLGFF